MTTAATWTTPPSPHAMWSPPTPSSLATFPPKIRLAITEGKLTGGMTREQVLMAVGYPISSENPNLDASLWRYWRTSFAEYQVQFGPSGKLVKVTADPQLMNLVWIP